MLIVILVLLLLLIYNSITNKEWRMFWPRDDKTFSMLNSAEHEICSAANKFQITNDCKFFLDNIPKHENFPANKYEIASIFSVISRENFVLRRVEHGSSAELRTEKKFYNLGFFNVRFFFFFFCFFFFFFF